MYSHMQTCVCRHVLFSISLYSLISKHALSVLCSPFPRLTYTHAHAIVMSVKLQCCLYARLVGVLCLVCLLAVCLFVLSCVTHDCACACIVCLLVCAVMCDSCLCLCFCCMSACVLHLTPCSAKLVCWPVPKTQSKRKIAHSTSSSLSSSSEVNDEFVSHSSVPHSMSPLFLCCGLPAAADLYLLTNALASPIV